MDCAGIDRDSDWPLPTSCYAVVALEWSFLLVNIPTAWMLWQTTHAVGAPSGHWHHALLRIIKRPCKAWKTVFAQEIIQCDVANVKGSLLC